MIRSIGSYHCRVLHQLARSRIHHTNGIRSASLHTARPATNKSSAFASSPASSTSSPSSSSSSPFISIDRSGLLGEASRLAAAAAQDDKPVNVSQKSPATPLTHELHAQMNIRGPLSVSDYMFQCLQNPQHGYYTSQPASRIIGGKANGETNDSAVTPEGGDFITSPELGQIFGEMLGVWVVQTWQSLGSPSQFRLLELGPGRGTLMQDMLRTIRKFPQAAQAVSIHMCETSNTMRDEQVKKLQVQNVTRQVSEVKKGASTAEAQAVFPAQTPADATATPNPSTAPSQPQSDSHSESLSQIVKADLLLRQMMDLSKSPDIIMHGRIPMQLADSASDASSTSSSSASIPIHWHSRVNEVPRDGGPLIVVAHEFFDALPVYQFERTERGWCEVLVDKDIDNGPHHLRFVLSPQPTLASRTFLPESRFPLSASRIGDRIEIGAAGLAAMEELSRRLSESEAGGAALVIDYGTDHPNANTLQAMRSHSFVPVLSEPGLVDLTTLVDFRSLRATVERTNTYVESPLTVLPLVTQSHFLRNLNIAARLEQMVTDAEKASALTPEHIETIIKNAVKLVNPNREEGGMGHHFKVMCVVSHQLSKAENNPFHLKDGGMEEEMREYQKLRPTNQSVFTTPTTADTTKASASTTQSSSSTVTASTLSRREQARAAAVELAKARAEREKQQQSK